MRPEDIERRASFQIREDDNGELVDQHGNPFDTHDYSRFKYGDSHIGRAYGFELAEELEEELETFLAEGGEIIIASSAFKYLPTASDSVARGLTHAINHLLHLEGVEPTDRIRIHRRQLLEGDYGTLTEEERRAIMKNNQLYVDKFHLEGKRLLIVDDVRITGAHEERLAQTINDLDMMSVLFLYVVELNPEDAKKDPTIEDRMNHAYMFDLSRLANIVETPGFVLNARTCKYVLGYGDLDQLKSFFGDRSDEFIYMLYAGSIADGYINMASYQDAIEMLQSELEQRGMLQDGQFRPPQREGYERNRRSR